MTTSDRPYPLPYPPTGPQFQPRPSNPIPPFPPTEPPPARATSWACYRCGRMFIHARFLATHLIDIHNEQPAARRSLRIGHGPRLPYRVRAVRLLTRLGRLGVAWALVVTCVWWLQMGQAAVFVVGMFLTSVICGRRRPAHRAP